jgi:hypothetical protein
MDRQGHAEVPAAERSEHDEIQKNIDEVYTTINENQAEYDKQLLTLSSGFLAVSLAFIKDVVPLKDAELLWILYLAFVLLALCIVTVLFSYQFSIAGLFRAKEYWDSLLAGNKDAKFPYAFARHIRRVNKVSGILFLLGVSSLVLFVILNVNHEANNPIDRNAVTTNGANIKAPPPATPRPGPGTGAGNQPGKP